MDCCIYWWGYQGSDEIDCFMGGYQKTGEIDCCIYWEDTKRIVVKYK